MEEDAHTDPLAPLGLPKWLFWDVDLANLDAERNARFIIGRVLEMGEWKDWCAVVRHYGMDRIVAECRQMRTMNPVDLAYICAVSGTDKETYRCFHTEYCLPVR